jgi:hypothetical protein
MNKEQIWVTKEKETRVEEKVGKRLKRPSRKSENRKGRKSNKRKKE